MTLTNQWLFWRRTKRCRTKRSFLWLKHQPFGFSSKVLKEQITSSITTLEETLCLNRWKSKYSQCSHISTLFTQLSRKISLTKNSSITSQSSANAYSMALSTYQMRKNNKKEVSKERRPKSNKLKATFHSLSGPIGFTTWCGFLRRSWSPIQESIWRDTIKKLNAEL